VITNESDWKLLQDKAASLIEQLEVEQLEVDFPDKKYGSFYRNIHGIIEPLHYHLGQIVILKRIIRKRNP
jgi:hypothetical protein